MKQEGGKRVARRGAWLMGSTALQTFLVFAIITISAKIGAKVIEDKVVDVKFVKMAPPPPPPPPPAPRRTTPKPKTETPRKPPSNPMAMVQPKDVPAELKPPDPNEKPEEEDVGSDEGVEGGVVGGVVGGTPSVEEAPQYMMAGFRKPVEAQPGCVKSSMRVPPSLQGFISGPITVKFAVQRDGSIGQVQIMSQVPDARIGDVIRQGLASCRWVPGADAQGRPVSIWVIMPIRFAGG